MNRVILSLLFALLSAASLAAMGTGDFDPSRTDYGIFDSVSIAVAAETELIRGSVCSVTADIPRGMRDEISIANKGGRLVVERKHGSLFRFGRESIRLTITMPKIESLHMAGSGSLTSRYAWEGDHIEVTSSGSASTRIESLASPRVSLTTTGSGGIRLADIRTNQAELRSTGSGNIDVEDIKGEEIHLSITGSGEISAKIYAGRLNSSQTGSGDIRVSGVVSRAELRTTGSGNFNGRELATDEVDITITGSGDIRLREGSRLRTVTMTGSGAFLME